MANGNETGQVSAPGNKLKTALARDWVSSIKNFMGGVVRISVALVVSLVPIGLAYIFLRPESEDPGGPVIEAMNWLEKFLLGTSSEGSEADTSSEDSEADTSSEDSKDPAIDVLEWLEHLPTEPAF